ncbi:hypothetical protein HSRCO_0728 [Halanaeroarchaeum sp. HSR-CO]|uniref:hypothetical protein n=1 Tax=Halanaeroarchaeum sp. HSR-CO TaxID=2866382 RepID=UPI00217E2C35|nr:hypothetical protein [Halanaeroarchaeum sp. HSR-CO]UWG47022.1 hypothetical protein HSRCO_0728 [Halanaeroarchaeum sp. HSR-CO]
MSNSEENQSTNQGQPSSSEGSGEISQRKSEVLLTEYQELQENLRGHKKRWSRRITRGLFGSILLIGYAFQTENRPLFVLLPILMTPLLIAHVIEENTVVDIISKLEDIEGEFPADNFDYFTEYETLSRDKQSEKERRVIWSMNSIIGLTYIGFMAAGLVYFYRTYSIKYTLALGVLDMFLIVLMVGLFLANEEKYHARYSG